MLESTVKYLDTDNSVRRKRSRLRYLVLSIRALTNILAYHNYPGHLDVLMMRTEFSGEYSLRVAMSYSSSLKMATCDCQSSEIKLIITYGADYRFRRASSCTTGMMSVWPFVQRLRYRLATIWMDLTGCAVGRPRGK